MGWRGQLAGDARDARDNRAIALGRGRRLGPPQAGSEVTKAAPAERRQANNQAALVIALVWILAVTMPAAELKLPPEAQQYLNGLYATIGLALIVTWRINDNRKH